MIVDVHVHLLNAQTDLADDFIEASGHAKAGGGVPFSLGWSDYTEAATDDTVAIVFGGKARLSGIWADDAKVAEFVAEQAGTTVGFLAVDPTQPGWEDEMRYSHLQLGLRGIKIMPMYAGFDPTDPAFDPLWRYASESNLPVISHTGTTFVPQAVLDYARPGLFDDVARRFPDLKLVLAHLGHPYEGECLAVIRKNPNVYADISALHYRPFQLWHSLMLAQDYAVGHKILFGSDFPFTTVRATLEGLRALGKVEIAGLGKLDAAFLQGIVEQDALSLLGLR